MRVLRKAVGLKPCASSSSMPRPLDCISLPSMMTWAPCPHGVRTRGKKRRECKAAWVSAVHLLFLCGSLQHAQGWPHHRRQSQLLREWCRSQFLPLFPFHLLSLLCGPCRIGGCLSETDFRQGSTFLCVVRVFTSTDAVWCPGKTTQQQTKQNQPQPTGRDSTTK